MDIYSRKSRWKIYLAIAGVVIVLISLVYTTWLTNKLAAEERTKAELLVEAWQTIYDDDNFDPNCEACADFTFYLKVINSNKTIPALIVTDGELTKLGVINFQNEDSLDSILNGQKKNGFKNLSCLLISRTNCWSKNHTDFYWNVKYEMTKNFPYLTFQTA